jgi:hypothetical protein
MHRVRAHADLLALRRSGVAYAARRCGFVYRHRGPAVCITRISGADTLRTELDAAHARGPVPNRADPGEAPEVPYPSTSRSSLADGA